MLSCGHEHHDIERELLAILTGTASINDQETRDLPECRLRLEHA